MRRAGRSGSSWRGWFRRVDSQMQVLERGAYAARHEELTHAIAEAVEEGLIYARVTSISYLRLIRFHLADSAHKDARRLLGRALARWPQDLKLLTAALDAAIVTGAFEKASGLARKILALDPIDSGVRERLVAAHLARQELGLAIAQAFGYDQNTELPLPSPPAGPVTEA